MHTLVTGGAGFIGAALVERLLAEGHTVDVVDNLVTGSLWNLADARAGAGRDLTFHQLDVRSPDVAELIARRRPEVVWHLAFHSTGGQAPTTDAQVNIVGTLGVIDGVRAAGARKLVVASSAAVYGDLAARTPATERHPRQPASIEGINKHTVDSYLAAYAEAGSLVFTSVVASAVYGPRSVGGVVAAWATCFGASRPCTVFGDGSQVRDFVYVDDVVDALARAADHGDGMFVNVSTGIGTSLADLHARMARVYGSDTPWRHGGSRPGDAAYSVLDPSRAAEVLGWQAWTPLDQGLTAVGNGAAPSADR